MVIAFRPKTRFIRMSHILGLCTPFKIAQIVIGFISINMVYIIHIDRMIWTKRLHNKSMHIHLFPIHV